LRRILCFLRYLVEERARNMFLTLHREIHGNGNAYDDAKSSSTVFENAKKTHSFIHSRYIAVVTRLSLINLKIFPINYFCLLIMEHFYPDFVYRTCQYVKFTGGDAGVETATHDEYNTVVCFRERSYVHFSEFG